MVGKDKEMSRIFVQKFLRRIGLTPGFIKYITRKPKPYRKRRFSLIGYIRYVWNKELFQKFED